MPGQDINGINSLITSSQQLVQAIGLLNQTLGRVFPQGVAITASAGGASGNYLTVIGTDGVTYKLQLLNV